jgi:hypothetical protein
VKRGTRYAERKLQEKVAERMEGGEGTQQQNNVGGSSSNPTEAGGRLRRLQQGHRQPTTDPNNGYEAPGKNDSFDNSNDEWEKGIEKYEDLITQDTPRKKEDEFESTAPKNKEFSSGVVDLRRGEKDSA